MAEIRCAVCREPVDDEAIRSGVCPNCGSDPIGSEPGLTWLASRLWAVAALIAVAVWLNSSVLIGIGLLALGVIYIQFRLKRGRYWQMEMLRSYLQDDQTPPREPRDR